MSAAAGWLVLALLGADAPSAPVLRFATLAPEGSSWVDGITAVDRELRAGTPSIALRGYPGGAQGDDAEILRKLESSKLQGALLSSLGLGVVAPWARVLEVPFQVRDRAQALALREAFAADLEAALGTRGLVVLGWLETGALYLFSAARIERPEGLRAARPWSMPEDPFAQRLYAQLKVTPVALPIGKVREALTSGAVDAVVHVPAACQALQWCGKLKYRLDLPVVFGVGAWVVRKDALDDAARARLAAAVQKQLASVNDRAHVQHQQAMTSLEKGGLSTVTPAAAAQAEFAQVGWQAAEALAAAGGSFDKAQLARVRRALGR